ncbi:TRAP transporter small permease [Salinicola endophyticus]|uniref:TRAP transporter small permease protein n=1 Tax=Salinicola endophyticus TaxID=1949083 RepID=A0ABY8FBY0_9GAMM|nr:MULTISPECIES: TRAP transporter small permease [Salinicola]WFF40077.1 TRAP transporter small permease [Salinicola endophyticus]
MTASSSTARGVLGWLKLTLEIAVGLLVLGVVFCVTANVFGRYVLNYSYTWAEEMSRVLFIWLVLLGAGVGSLGNEHVAVTFFRDKAPTALKRAASLLAIAVIYIVCICILLGFRDLISGYTSATPMLGIPQTFLYSAMPVMAILTLIANSVALVALLRGKTP